MSLLLFLWSGNKIKAGNKNKPQGSAALSSRDGDCGSIPPALV